MYLYAITDNIHVKVGISSNVTKRISQLQTGTPNYLRLLIKVACGSREQALRLEKVFHQRYIRRRIYGEWFSTPAETVLSEMRPLVGVSFAELDAYIEKANYRPPFSACLTMRGTYTPTHPFTAPRPSTAPYASPFAPKDKDS